MRRDSLHLAFGFASLMAAALAGNFGWQWWQAQQLNAAVARAGQSDAPMDEHASPESQLARALALSRSGSSKAAIGAYKALTQNERSDIRQAALYNLGNHYLREALRDGPNEATRYMPLIELAKQSYRNVLRLNSNEANDWDARYNLELALRLAPEYDEQVMENADPLVPKERAITTMQGQKLLLP